MRLCGAAAVVEDDYLVGPEVHQCVGFSVAIGELHKDSFVPRLSQNLYNGSHFTAGETVLGKVGQQGNWR
jgi:hypothetical protein